MSVESDFSIQDYLTINHKTCNSLHKCGLDHKQCPESLEKVSCLCTPYLSVQRDGKNFKDHHHNVMSAIN